MSRRLQMIHDKCVPSSGDAQDDAQMLEGGGTDTRRNLALSPDLGKWLGEELSDSEFASVAPTRPLSPTWGGWPIFGALSSRMR